MDLIKYALLNKNKCIERIQCGWKFQPRICLNQHIYLETPFEHKCITCKKMSLIDDLENFCENCYESNIYDINVKKEIYEKIYNLDVEIIEEKTTKYLDHSVIYKIKIKEFYCLMFCGIFEEPNEWSSGPHDDYVHLTLLFIDEDLCNKEYLLLEKIKEYINL